MGLKRTCDGCGALILKEAELGRLEFLPHDCIANRIAEAVAKERSRIACVIRRVAERWNKHGDHEFARLLIDVSWAIEQETA